MGLRFSPALRMSLFERQGLRVVFAMVIWRVSLYRVRYIQSSGGSVTRIVRHPMGRERGVRDSEHDDE
jgi:hypothetical protein